MTELPRDRIELLAALHAAGAASAEEEAELQDLLASHPELQPIVTDFENSVVALASSIEPIETSPESLRSIEGRIRTERGGWLAAIRRWFVR